MLLVSILKEEDRIDDAVNLLINEGEFSMRIKGYSILVEYGRLLEARNYLSNLTTSSDEENNFVDVQNIYLDALEDQSYTPKSSDLSFLNAESQQNTVLAGYAASVYFYLIGEVIEGVHHYVDPRSREKSNYKSDYGISIYPNPFTDNQLNIIIDGFDNKTSARAEVYSISGRLMLKQPIINHETNLIFSQNLEKGIYFYKVYFDEIEFHAGKLIKI